MSKLAWCFFVLHDIYIWISVYMFICVYIPPCNMRVISCLYGTSRPSIFVQYNISDYVLLMYAGFIQFTRICFFWAVSVLYIHICIALYLVYMKKSPKRKCRRRKAILILFYLLYTLFCVSFFVEIRRQKRIGNSPFTKRERKRSSRFAQDVLARNELSHNADEARFPQTRRALDTFLVIIVLN